MLKIKHLYFFLFIIFLLTAIAILLGVKIGKLEPDIYYIKPGKNASLTGTVSL